MLLDRLQSLVATGQFLAAYREVERLVMDPHIDRALLSKVYLVGARAALGLREVYAAAKMAEKAVEAAELGSNWEEIGSARLLSAIIYRELGDTALAVRFFRLFFDYLDRYPELEAKTAHAYYNLGLTYQQRREYAEALAAYERAVRDFERIGHAGGVIASLQNSAWVMLLEGRPSPAAPLLRQSELLCADSGETEYQVTQLVVEAFYAWHTGDHHTATALCEEVFQPRREGVEDHHRSAAAWIMANLTLEADRLHEAGIFADWAMNYALQAKEPHYMNLACEIRQRVTVKKSMSS